MGQGEAARLVEEAKAGIVVSPENPLALADAVLRLLGNSELVQEFGRNGRQFVETNLRWSKLIGEWLDQWQRA